MSGGEPKYVTVSLPKAITDEIDILIEELGYWPSRSAFVREACLQKLYSEKERLRELRESSEATEESQQGGRPSRGTNPGISPRQTARESDARKLPKMVKR